ncbi:MAG: DNA topology modulation protein [Xenococcaceae cyanobacterium]
MQRITIIGSSGSGKSTLAKKLEQKLDIPVIHLDRFYWQPGWIPRLEADWIDLQCKLLQGDRWIVDGNYLSTMDLRLEAADTIIFLDFKRSLCLWRVTKRYLKYRGRTRSDMASDCPERLTLDFLQWVWNFQGRSRPKIQSKLEAHQKSKAKEVFILQNPKQVSDFLDRIEAIA